MRHTSGGLFQQLRWTDATSHQGADGAYPRLLEGARRGPDDVGGQWSYGEFLEAIADPSTNVTQNCSNGAEATSTHSSSILTGINGVLASLAPRKNTRRRTAKPAVDK